MLEWEVPCDWCGTKAGEPCKDNHDKVLIDKIHRPRAKLYDDNHGLNYMDRDLHTRRWIPPVK